MRHNSPPYGALPANGYIRQQELIPAIVPWSPSTLWRKVRAGEFPAPVKLSTRITAWRAEAVKDWLEKRGRAEGSATACGTEGGSR